MVVAGVSGVGQHPVGAAALLELHLRPGPVEQHAPALLPPPRAPAGANRNLPDPRAVAGRPRREPPVLRDLQECALGPTAHPGLHPRDARVIEEGVERRRDVAAGGGGDAGQEVARGGVPVGVRAEVRLDSPAEGLGADPLLEHPEHGRALLVGDGVERVLHVVVAVHGLADHAGARQRVRLRRLVAVLHPLRRHAPRRCPALDDLGLHPGREGLVEPDVVPPGRGDQVSEPLVGELVCRDRRVGAPTLDPVLLGTGQDQRLAEGDQAHVLHRAELHGEGDGQHVELLVRVGDAEVVLEPLEDLRRYACRPRPPRAPVRGER